VGAGLLNSHPVSVLGPSSGQLVDQVVDGDAIFARQDREQLCGAVIIMGDPRAALVPTALLALALDSGLQASGGAAQPCAQLSGCVGGSPIQPGGQFLIQDRVAGRIGQGVAGGFGDDVEAPGVDLSVLVAGPQ